jgi:hypothetical protein
MYQQWRWQPHGCDLPRYDNHKLSWYSWSISSSILLF